MPLDRLLLAGYRCFAEPQIVDLCPLTVILGRNNSGKSALARAPVVLETGMNTESAAPLDLDSLVQIGETGVEVDRFEDLIYGNRPHASIQVEMDLQDDRDSIHLSALIQNIDEYRTQVVSRLEIATDDQHFTLAWEPEAGLGEAGFNRYTVQREHSWRDISIRFQGLLPVQILDQPQLPPSVISAILTKCAEARSRYPTIRYVGPFRDQPQRRYRLPAGTPRSVGPSGRDAAGILIDDVIRRQGRLLKLLNLRMSRELPGWKLDVLENGALYSVVLTSMDSSMSINLADTGTGIAQELPLLVQRMMDSIKPPSRPVLEIVEQPELHLHPAAHADLADSYLDATRSGNVRFLIETHSETFVLRLRRRIAEGSCPASSVGLYFVEQRGGASSVRRINIDDDGALDYWPEGVFSEDYDEARAIAAAQQVRDASAR